MEKKKFTDDFLRFLSNSPTAFQATYQIKETLVNNGFILLKETDKWNLIKGNKYFIIRNDSSIIAFVMGEKIPTETGYKMIGAHTDSPSLKLKPDTEKKDKSYIKIGVEVYGGPIIHTWLDKELSIAGRVAVKTKQGIESKLFDYKKHIAIIPNAAIHMNRELNKGFEYNKQTHLPAILSISDKEIKNGLVKEIIAEKLDISIEDIYDYDLFLYDPTPARLVGHNDELIVSGRLDDLAMSHATLNALIEADAPESTIMGIFYDNEEIGSQTRQGANSSFLKDLLLRINCLFNGNMEDYAISIAKSFLISADMAHAYHPSYVEKHDPAYAPEINKGPVIKMSANFKYATTAETSAYFEDLCHKAEVPFQKMINKSDLPSGSTIGPMSSARLSIKTVDIGNAMWAMHSIRETGGIEDQVYIYKVFREFFQ